MITIRPARERGHFDHGWLDTFHTFSFSEYRDEKFMGWGPLRVINEDRVQPGQGFPTHGHRDMEIITYVLAGALEHRDSLGTGSVIRPGDVQRMSAGTGVRHSEYNPSPTESLHLLQIWIEPRSRGIPPGYEQKAFTEADRRGRLCLVASPDGADDYMIKPFEREELRARIHAGRRVLDLERSLADRVVELEDALHRVKLLQGLIPICAWCKKVRDDRNYWQQVEQYVTEHSEAQFTHSICPDCRAKYADPEIQRAREEREAREQEEGRSG